MRRPALLIVFLVLVVASLGLAFLVFEDRPNGPDRRMARGRGLLAGEEHLRALDIFEQAVRDDPNNAAARTWTGIAHLRLNLYLSAIEQFELATGLAPSRGDPWIGLAHAHLALGNVSESISAALEATRIDPGAIEAWDVLAQAHWLDRSYSDAESAALEARSLKPDDLQALEALLYVYMDRDEPEKFESLIHEIPAGRTVLETLVVSFFVRQGQFARAWEHKSRFDRRQAELDILEAELALGREPSRAELYPQLIRDLVVAGIFDRAIAYGRVYRGPESMDLEIGKALWMSGDVAGAVSRFESASRHGGHKLSAQVALAIITGRADHWHEAFQAEHVERDYLILGQLDELVQSGPAEMRPLIWRYVGIYEPYFYNRAVEDGTALAGPESDDLNILLTMGTAYERLGRIDEARRYVERARDAYPTQSEPVSRLAVLALADGEPNRVVELMERALSLDPSDAGNLYNLGWLYDQLGRKDEALALYNRAIDVSGLSFEAMNNLALIYSEREQFDDARSLLERVIAVDSASEAAYFNLAKFYGDQRRWKPALSNYDRVLQINPRNSAAWVERGRIQLRLGDPEAAVRQLNFALELNSQEFDAYVLASSAYEQLGHVEAALAAAEEADRIRPDDGELDATLARLKERKSETN
jgi:tetratricopeptide (TPR) repeat protein